jgi:galactonate dehydratase
VLTRVHTDAGISGIGDASHGRDERVVKLLREIFSFIQGRNVFDVEHLRKAAAPIVAANGVSGACALSGIEQCLWDLMGKSLNVPAYALFGGKLHARLRNYANINRSTTERKPTGFAKYAEAAVRDGFDAIKLAPFDGMPRGRDDGSTESEIRLGLDCAEAVRKAIGPSRALLIDGHSHFSLKRGLKLAQEFEPLDLFWLEEVSPGIANLAEINRAAKMPTAGGESVIGVKGYFPYIAGGAVDITMPDVKYCGGMMELKKIAAMAEGAGLLTSPHGPASPVGNVSAGQVCVTMPNFQILEFSYGEVPWRAEIVDPPEQLEKGHLTISDRPGFGITLNDRAIKQHGGAPV